MNNSINPKTREVESKRIFAWSVTISPKSGILRDVRVLSNDIDVHIDTIEKYHLGKVVSFCRLPSRDIVTGQFKTSFDKMDSHWNMETPYPQKMWQEGRNTEKLGYDYNSISLNGVWGAGTLDGSKSMYSYTTLGLHAHTQALMNGLIESGLPVMDFRR